MSLPPDRGERPAPGQRDLWSRVVKTYVGSDQRYSKRDIWMRKSMGIMDDLEQEGSEGKTLRGEVAADIASKIAQHGAEPATVQQLLVSAQRNWHEVIHPGRPYRHAYEAQAAMRLAAAPAQEALLVQRELPAPFVQAQVYSNLVGVGLQLGASLREISDPAEESLLVGKAGEVETLMLLQRLNVRLFPTDDTYAAFSSFSEDIGDVHATAEGMPLTGWDISRFQQLAEGRPPQLLGKVQVKSSREPHDPPYDSDIALIIPWQDLRLAHEDSLHAGTISRECSEEFALPGGHTSEILDARTDLLLTKLAEVA